jgi:hypothetical protein
MNAYKSIPPVLDPVVANAQADLDALMAYADARRRAKPVTTLSTPDNPAIIEAADIAYARLVDCGEGGELCGEIEAQEVGEARRMGR